MIKVELTRAQGLVTRLYLLESILRCQSSIEKMVLEDIQAKLESALSEPETNLEHEKE